MFNDIKSNDFPLARWEACSRALKDAYVRSCCLPVFRAVFLTNLKCTYVWNGCRHSVLRASCMALWMRRLFVGRRGKSAWRTEHEDPEGQCIVPFCLKAGYINIVHFSRACVCSDFLLSESKIFISLKQSAGILIELNFLSLIERCLRSLMTLWRKGSLVHLPTAET